MDPFLLIILVVAGIGILDTLYLSYHVFTKTPVACWLFPKEWCLKVQNSAQSRTLGIPNAFAGLMLYSGILFFTLMFLKGWLPFWPIAALIGFGFAFSMYFLYVQAFELRAFCTWCVVSAINFVILAGAALMFR